MNKKIKKIVTATILSVTASSALGCATTNTKIAQKINNGVNDFVSSINKLDYVDTNNTPNKTLGKIVSAVNDSQVFNAVTSGTNIENTITKPESRTDNFKLYTLSSTPFISLTSDENNVTLSIEFSTEKIENTSDEINNKINKLILKRAILMVYINEIYSGNVNLTDESRRAINAYVNVIKENASFLNGNRGMVKNQLNMASNLINSQNNDNIINYYIIKSGEALEIRSNKIDSTISAIDSIISILELNLTPSSCYYQNSLTTSYENMLSNLNNSNSSDENTLLAKNIAESINLLDTGTENQIENSKINTTNPNITTNNLNSTTNNLNNNTRTSNPIHNTISQQTQTRNNNNNNLNKQSNNLQQNQKNENQIQTLEEHENNVINQQNNNLNNRDFSRQTPSQRTRTRRITRNNEHNNYNPTMNPGSLNKTISTENNTQDTSGQITRNKNTNNSEQTISHKATRVPYKISSNIED